MPLLSLRTNKVLTCRGVAIPRVAATPSRPFALAEPSRGLQIPETAGTDSIVYDRHAGEAVLSCITLCIAPSCGVGVLSHSRPFWRCPSWAVDWRDWTLDPGSAAARHRYQARPVSYSGLEAFALSRNPTSQPEHGQWIGFEQRAVCEQSQLNVFLRRLWWHVKSFSVDAISGRGVQSGRWRARQKDAGARCPLRPATVVGLAREGWRASQRIDGVIRLSSSFVAGQPLTHVWSSEAHEHEHEHEHRLFHQTSRVKTRTVLRVQDTEHQHLGA